MVERQEKTGHGPGQMLKALGCRKPCAQPRGANSPARARSFSLRAQPKATPKVCSAKEARVNFRNSGIECHHDSAPAPIVEAPAAQAEKTKNLGKISTMLRKFSETWKNFPYAATISTQTLNAVPTCGGNFLKCGIFLQKLRFFVFSCGSAALQKKEGAR